MNIKVKTVSNRTFRMTPGRLNSSMNNFEFRTIKSNENNLVPEPCKARSDLEARIVGSYAVQPNEKLKYIKLTSHLTIYGALIFLHIYYYIRMQPSAGISVAF